MRGSSSVRIGSVALGLALSAVGGSELLGQTPGCPTQYNGFNTFHGDADIAVGTRHVLVVDHDYIRVTDKCGLNQLFSAPLYTGFLPDGLVLTGIDPLNSNVQGLFYNAVPAGSTGSAPTDAIDPEVHYDPLTARFFVMMHKANEQTVGTPEDLYIGGSDVENARAWPRLLQFSCTLPCNPQNALTLLDRGTIAIDQTDVWFSGWVGDPSANGCASPNSLLQRSYALGRIDKADLLDPQVTPGASWINVQDWDDTQPNLARRLSFNDGNPQYAVGGGFAAVFQTPPGYTTVLSLYTIKHSGGQVLPPSRADVSITPAWNTFLLNDIPQPPPPSGHTAPAIDVEPMPFIWSAVYRNGSVWCANVGTDPSSPGRCWIRWYQIAMNGWQGGATNVPTIAQWGEIDPGNGMSAWVPSVSVDCNNNFAVTYNVVGPNAGQFVEVRTSYRCPSDMPNTLRAPVTLYSHNTWVGLDQASPIGSTDFSGTMVDPTVRGRFWTHHGLAAFPGQTFSKVVRFDTNCGADLNCDADANAADTAMFISAFASGAPEADYVPDEQATADDAAVFGELTTPK